MINIYNHKENLLRDYRIQLNKKTTESIRLEKPNTYHPDQNDIMIYDDVKVAYYSQDFGTLDPSMNVWDSLREMNNVIDQDIYRVASQFLLSGQLLKNNI